MYLFIVIELIDRYCPLLLFLKSKYFSANFKNTNKYIPARIQNRILSPSVNAEFPSKIIRTKSRISGMTLTLKTLFSMSNLDASSQNISSSCSIIVAGFLKYVQPPEVHQIFTATIFKHTDVLVLPLFPVFSCCANKI